MQPRSEQPFLVTSGSCAATDAANTSRQPSARSVVCSTLAWGLPGRDAVEEAVTSSALQIVLAAAAVRPARGMRRVPRLRRVVVAQSLPVVMADHRGALSALGPVAAGAILAGREGGAVRLRAGEHIVHVRRVAAPVHRVTLLGQRGLLVDVVGAVQLGHVLGDDDALGVLPGALADAV